MKNCCCVLLVLGMVTTLPADEKQVVKVWPHGLPPGAKTFSAEQIKTISAKTTKERIAWVGDPTMTIYPAPKEKANGCAVVVCPGGGYHILAWEHEGVEVAEWFNSLGVTAAVLKYRVPRRDPQTPHQEPLQDAQRAIRIMRHNAKAWNIDPNRVGVLGFSAGGHLTVMTALAYNEKTYPPTDDIDKESSRPDFVMPIYAAYLGDKEKKAELSPMIKVNKQTPPMFLSVTWDDSWRGVHSALLFAELKKVGVPAEVHVYSKGGHGYGLRPSENPVSTWHHRCGEWLRVSGYLKKP